MHAINQRIIDAAIAAGGKATTAQQITGYLTANTYGQVDHPYRHMFTITTIRFAEPIDFAVIADAAGAENQRPNDRPIDSLEVYDHEELTPAFGANGRGIVIALSHDANRNRRYNSHIVLTKDGTKDQSFANG